MKKALVAGLLIAGMVLGGCSNPATEELEKNDTDKAQAKVENQTPLPSNAQGEAGAEEKKDVWTYYNNAKWSTNWDGLKMDILKVVVTDKGDVVAPEYKSLVGVKFRMENTTNQKFTVYPDQAVLITSTGEQIEMPDMFLSDHLGGEIHEGVVKEGNLIWVLQRGHAEDIKWIKLEFTGHKGAEDQFDMPMKKFTVTLQLKK